MSIIEVFILAIGLAMDAFAVSVCKGLAMRKLSVGKLAICGLWFGSFQALMPVIGYLIGVKFASYIVKFDHFIAFFLLGIIGLNMIKEAINGEEEETDESLNFKVMLVMAIATSIDALAVGITFACVPVAIAAQSSTACNMLIGAGMIGVITFCLSCVGVKVGNVFGVKYKKRAELVGGAVLILLGLKILLEHLINNI